MASELERQLDTYLQESERVMNICNACRYCEGFCAVFPAMEKKLEFGGGDLRYLANLCHDCQECYHACQYAPPHEFNINVPRAMSGLRRQSYRDYAWPGFMASIFSRTRYAVIISMLFIPLLFLLAGIMVHGVEGLHRSYSDAEGSFYSLVPHGVMASGFGVAGLYVLLALWMGWHRFCVDIGMGTVTITDIRVALKNALGLRYLGSSGEGCTYPGEHHSLARRWFHHFTFYGFMLCFAATSVATLYHYLFAWYAPYPFLSLPVILGTLGGLGLIIGPAGLLSLKAVRDTGPADDAQTGMDVTFLVLLLMISITGLMLLFLRETALMGWLLLVHLGLVMGLFLSMPYGKFVHGLYRLGALIRSAKEERGQ